MSDDTGGPWMLFQNREQEPSHGPWELFAEAPKVTPEVTPEVTLEEQPARGSQLVDLAKGAGIGLAKGAIGLAGLPGSIKAGEDWLLDKILGPIPASSPRPRIDLSPPTGSAIQGAIEGLTGPFYEPQTTAGKYAETVSEFIPGALSLPGGAAANVARYGIVPGLASEAAGQVTEGTAAEPLARGLAATAGALAGPSIANLPGRLVSPLPMAADRARLVETLQREGIPLTAGQATGSKPLLWAESTLADMPFAGGRGAAIQEAQGKAFTEAALKRAGVEGELATAETMAAGKAGLGRKFEEIAARNELQPDKKMAGDLSKAMESYEKVAPPSMRAAGPKAATDDVLGFAVRGESISGETYQTLRSELTRTAEGLRASDPPQAQVYREIRNSLDNAMDRSISRTNPKDAGAWAKVRKEYANYKAIEKAAAGAGEATAAGYISPSQLRSALAAGNKRADYVVGKGDLAALARAGEAIMKPLPQSGTAPRLYTQRGLELAGAGAGALAGGAEGLAGGLATAIAAPAVAGRALMSRPVQAYLRNQVVTKFGTFPRTKAGMRSLAAAMQAHQAITD